MHEQRKTGIKKLLLLLQNANSTDMSYLIMTWMWNETRESILLSTLSVINRKKYILFFWNPQLGTAVSHQTILPKATPCTRILSKLLVVLHYKFWSERDNMWENQPGKKELFNITKNNLVTKYSIGLYMTTKGGKAYCITNVTTMLLLSSWNKKPQKRSPPEGQKHCHQHTSKQYLVFYGLPVLRVAHYGQL